MSEAFEEYVCVANDVIDCRFISSSDDLGEHGYSFQPYFTHQIISESRDEEKLYGYKMARIKLFFSPSGSVCYFNANWEEKSKQSIPVDLNSVFLPHVVDPLLSLDSFERKSLEDQQSFVPPGTLVQKYTQCDKESGKEAFFEVYQGNLYENEECKEYLKRIQIFVLLFINGSNYLNTEESGWKILFLFEKKPYYQLVGFLTCYSFFAYPDKIRQRISQFLILPPFEQKGHGGRLYDSFCSYIRNDDNVIDFTIECPSDDLSHLRDVHDLFYLQSLNIKGSDLLTEFGLNECRKTAKLCPKQLRHCGRALLSFELNSFVGNQDESQKVTTEKISAMLYRSIALEYDVTMGSSEHDMLCVDSIEQFKEIETSLEKLRTMNIL